MQQLDERRKKIGISVTYLSRVAMVTTATYRNWRDGRRPVNILGLEAMQDAVDSAEAKLRGPENG